MVCINPQNIAVRIKRLILATTGSISPKCALLLITFYINFHLRLIIGQNKGAEIPTNHGPKEREQTIIPTRGWNSHLVVERIPVF